MLGALTLAGSFVTAASEPVFFIHVTEVSFSGCSDVDPRSLSCGEVNATGESDRDEFAWLLVGDVDGEVGAVQFGVEYASGVEVAQWVLCTGGAEIVESGWPASGAGNAVTWANGCYETGGSDMAKIGFLYVRSGSSGHMKFVPDPRAGLLMVDCFPNLIEACAYNGSAGFGRDTGFVPQNCECSGPPVEISTWSSIKSRYGN